MPVLGSAAIGKAYKAYVTVFGRMPEADVDLTKWQWTSLNYLLVNGLPPYVDFSLWAPNHYRMLKKLRARGLALKPNGEIEAIELLGPPTYEQWQECYSV